MKFEEWLLLVQIVVMGVAALIGLKLNSRVIKLEQQTEDDKETIKNLKSQMDSYKNETMLSVTNLTMRLLEIENKLIETNTYLKENLRYLTIIVNKHETKLDQLDNGIRSLERKS